MEDDQEKVLEDAKRVVKEQAYFMRKACEEANLRTALKHAANMLGELRTNLLSPRNYYVLFMQVFDDLRELEAHFREEFRRGRNLKDLYENVQHAGFIIPRIYLLITVGSVYIGSMDVPAKSILSDLLEMIRGIQHPIKGLFVRYYFLKMMKDKLPDTGSHYEGEGGDVNDAIRCVLSNLAEMNKLWVKMQTQGGKDKAKKERERTDVKVTIGENLVRLFALNGCTLEAYQTIILDFLIDTITSTKDTMSQQYLLDIIIQAFPDEFHLQTLEKLLKLCGVLMQNEVDVKTIFIRLMERLADFAGSGDEGVNELTQQVDIFSLFKTNIDKIIEEQAHKIELSKLLELQSAFLKFVQSCYPSNIDYVNQILESCCVLCAKKSSTEVNDESQKYIVRLLTTPLESLSMKVLTLNEFPKLMKYLPLHRRKVVAFNIAKSVGNAGKTLNDQTTVNQLVEFLKPILVDEAEAGKAESEITLEEEQSFVGRVTHLAFNEDPHEYFAMLNIFRTELLAGGEKRIIHTVPSLVYAYLRFARYVAKCQANPGSVSDVEPETQETEGVEETPKSKGFRGEIKITYLELFTIVKELIEKLTLQNPELCLRLNLTLILSINEIVPNKELDEFTYEICTETLHIYQDEIADAEAKMSALTEIAAAFQRLTCLSEDNFDTLVANTTQYCAKLLKKSEQCLGILKCTHLFYCDAWKNEQRVMECFKKVLKLAEVVNNTQPSNKHLRLYVAIINKFIYFLEQDEFNAITPDDVLRCINLVKEKTTALEKEPDAESLRVYFSNTLKLIEEKKQSNPKFTEIITN